MSTEEKRKRKIPIIPSRWLSGSKGRRPACRRGRGRLDQKKYFSFLFSGPYGQTLIRVYLQYTNRRKKEKKKNLYSPFEGVEGDVSRKYIFSFLFSGPYGQTLIKIFLLFISLVISDSGFSQSQLSSENKKALKYFDKAQTKAKERDFDAAIELFNDALKKDQQFYEAYLRKGSLFNAMGMEDSVYANFSEYLKLTPIPIGSVLNRMALMALDRGEYSHSSVYLEKLLQLIPELNSKREIQLLEENLEFAQKEIENEARLEINPLPIEVNRFSLQYLPSITIDNSTLIYTKRDAIEGDEDIVVSFFKDGNWSAAQSISSKINSPLNEGASTISADGKLMIFTSCDKRDSFGSCDLYISRKTGENWSKPRNLGKPINSIYWESQPSLSADGKSLYFSSNRPGGKGGRDLWVSSFKNEKWSKPQNLGNVVNTFKDETTPFIHSNGETLYFSSNGHIGMGGFDLIKSNKIDSAWTLPQNLGFPINTFKDEVGLLIGGDGRTAYFAKEEKRNGQIVDSKIVSFALPEIYKARPATYVIGKVLDYVSGQPLKARVEIIDLNKNRLLYEANSDSTSGNYTMVLPSEKELVCYVKKRGYLFYENNFFTESNSIIAPDTIEIRLKSIAVNEFLVLENIYFDVDSYILNKKSQSELSSIVQLLKENLGIVVEISGHTDNSGSKDYNQALSKNRANQIYKELIKGGISREKLEYVGYGDRKPIASNTSESGRQSNRRIEFRVLRIMN